MKTEISTGSNLSQTIEELPVEQTDSQKRVGAAEQAVGLSSGAYTTSWTWRANGVFKKVPFPSAGINANSRVVASICEYGSDPRTTRFIGDARMHIYNIAPYNGGFYAWVEISWNSPLNVRIDAFVDP